MIFSSIALVTLKLEIALVTRKRIFWKNLLDNHMRKIFEKNFLSFFQSKSTLWVLTNEAWY